jgi:site-specific DNA-methyltransferase (adenine-specific)
MATLPDKAFDLAIVDPPYGGGDVAAFTPRAKGTTKNKIHAEMKWNIAPDKIYFNELFRISKNQIVWGADHYAEHLPPSRGWVFWDKLYENTFNFSAGELAWTSFDCILRMIRMSQRWIPGTENNIHPTQKPVALYKWLLTKYAKPGQTILDTHGGSGSIAIACHDLGFDLTWMELDADYYEAAVKRYQEHARQGFLFQPTPESTPPTQGTLI